MSRMRRVTSFVLTTRQRSGLLATINFLWVSAFLVLFAIHGVDAPGEAACVDRVIDFHAFWGAGSLAFAGEPLSAFDHATLLAAFDSCPRTGMFWLYPAPVLIILSAFGALPFIAGYIAITLISLTFISLAARQFVNGDLVAIALIAFAPAWLPALMSGQLTLLWCACLLIAISMLRRERNIAAGVVIGFLTLKPTLGLLIPVILLAEKRYKTIIAASVTTVILHLAATAYYGFEYTSLWMDVAIFQSAVERIEVAHNPELASVASFTTILGVSDHFSTYTNAVMFLVMTVLIFAVWRRYGARSDAAVSALCAAIPLSTPYLWHYDAGFSALTAMFLYLARPAKPPVYFWLLLLVFWFGPGIPIVNQTLFHVNWIYPTSVLPPILLIAFIYSLLQLPRTKTTTPARKVA